jgi:hypothetical protein
LVSPDTGAVAMTASDSIFYLRTSEILEEHGISAKSAKLIKELMEQKRRYVDLKNAAGELKISERTMYRRLASGRLHKEIIDGITMVDCGSRLAVARK